LQIFKNNKHKFEHKKGASISMPWGSNIKAPLHSEGSSILLPYSKGQYKHNIILMIIRMTPWN